MLNEIEEFKAYTDKPVYKCSGKRDFSFLGRFSCSLTRKMQKIDTQNTKKSTLCKKSLLKLKSRGFY